MSNVADALAERVRCSTERTYAAYRIVGAVQSVVTIEPDLLTRYPVLSDALNRYGRADAELTLLDAAEATA